MTGGILQQLGVQSKKDKASVLLREEKYFQKTWALGRLQMVCRTARGATVQSGYKH